MLELVKDDEWGLYPNFSKQEMTCKYTGQCKMTHKMMRLLQELRNEYGKPIIITSGYRDVSHPDERMKTKRGEHTRGMAADIKVSGVEAMKLAAIAYRLGARRFGLQQKGPYNARFIHIGIGDYLGRYPQALWTY